MRRRSIRWPRRWRGSKRRPATKTFVSFVESRPRPSSGDWTAKRPSGPGKPLARATVHSTLAALRAFFIWLAGQPGYKSKIAYGDADYFNLSEKDVRIAKAS